MNIAPDSDNRLENISCLCGENKGRVIHSIPPFSYVKCSACGLVYLTPRIKQEKIRDFYASDGYSSGEKEYEPVAEKDEYYSRFSSELKEILKIKESGKFLDIGSAWGYLLDAAKARGFEPYGVELSKTEAASARKLLGCDIFNGPLRDRKTPDSFFDVITCMHVLEHIPDPIAELKEIRRIIKPDGLLVIDVPVEKELKIHFSPEVERSLGINNPPDHIYYFSNKTLKRYLAETGFEVVKVLGHGGTGFCSGLQTAGMKKTGNALKKYFKRFSRLKNAAVKLFSRKDEITVYAIPIKK